jgi:hypothetical protein
MRQSLHTLFYVDTCVGLARTMYIRCICGIFGREITEYTVIYGVYIRFWPTLYMCCVAKCRSAKYRKCEGWLEECIPRLCLVSWMKNCWLCALLWVGRTAPTVLYAYQKNMHLLEHMFQLYTWKIYAPTGLYAYQKNMHLLEHMF